MKMDSKSYRLDEDKGTESDSCCSGSSSSNVFDYDAMRESLLNTTYSDLGTSAPPEASSKVKPEALNPGLLGKSELKIPVPWGHVQAKTWGNSCIGRPVLAVHGWNDNAGTFDKLIPMLPQDLYIVAVDMPGHGLSSHLPPGITYHYVDFVTTLKRIVAYLGWDKKKFIFMGHSMGSALGLMLASLYPDMVEKFISFDLITPMVDSAEEIPTRISTGISTFLHLDALEIKERKEPPVYEFEEAVERLMKVTKYSDYPVTEAAAKTLLVRGTRITDSGKYAFTRDQRLQTANFVRFTPEIMISILKNLKCHMLMINAQQKMPFTVTSKVYQVMRDMAINHYQKNCASFKLVEVPGNHFVHLNQPEAVAKYAAEFLRS